MERFLNDVRKENVWFKGSYSHANFQRSRLNSPKERKKMSLDLYKHN